MPEQHILSLRIICNMMLLGIFNHHADSGAGLPVSTLDGMQVSIPLISNNLSDVYSIYGFTLILTSFCREILGRPDFITLRIFNQVRLSLIFIPLTLIDVTVEKETGSTLCHCHNQLGVRGKVSIIDNAAIAIRQAIRLTLIPCGFQLLCHFTIYPCTPRTERNVLQRHLHDLRLYWTYWFNGIVILIISLTRD